MFRPIKPFVDQFLLCPEPGTDMFLAPLPPSVSARMDVLDTYGTTNMAFAIKDDVPRPRITSRIFERKPQQISDLSAVTPLAPTTEKPITTSDTDPAPSARVYSQQELSDEIVLQLMLLLADDVLKEAERRLSDRASKTANDIESTELEQQRSLLHRAFREIPKKLSEPSALNDRETRLRIIRSTLDYVQAIPALRKKYSAYIEPIKRFLHIGSGEVGFVSASRHPVALQPRNSGTPEPDHIPLMQFAGKTWQEICELCNFNPRVYQAAWYEALLARAAQGTDRAYLGAPYQVGKTYACLPLAVALGTTCFPGKTILIIAPQRVVKETIIEDLRRAHAGLKIGIIDADHKDFGCGYDVVVASLWTLGREDNLERLDPDHYAIVATDEALKLFTKTGRRVLKHLGFLDNEEKPQTAKGKFLFGFSADAGSFSFKDIFGPDTRVDEFDLCWYVKNKFLHEPVGIEVPYGTATDDWEVVTEEGETLAYPKDLKKYVAAVWNEYQRRFKGRKVVIAWPSILHAEVAAAYFKAQMGDEGFSYADHSNKSPEENSAAERKFQTGSGSLVLHGVKGLAVGFRAVGSAGLIFAYQTLSSSLYGQWVGRILGIHNNEPQREVLVVQMTGWRGKTARRAMTLARLMGIEAYIGDLIEYRPVKLSLAAVPKKYPVRFVVNLSPDNPFGLDFTAVSEERHEIVPSPTRVPALLQGVLEERFENDIVAMAAAIEQPPETLNNFMTGQLPKDYRVVRQIAESLFADNPSRFVAAWVDDFLDLMEGTYSNHPWGPDSAVLGLMYMIRRRSLFAIYSAEGVTRFENGIELTAIETAILGQMIRGEFVGESGHLLWNRELAQRIIADTVSDDDELIVQILDLATSEINTEAEKRQDRGHQETTVPEERKVVRDGSEPALFPDHTKISLQRKCALYATLNLPLSDLFAYRHVDSRFYQAKREARDNLLLRGDTKRRLNSLIDFLRERMPQTSASSSDAGLFLSVFNRLLHKRDFTLGNLIMHGSEEIRTGVSFCKHSRQRFDALCGVLAGYGLRPGMDVHGWNQHLDLFQPNADEHALLHTLYNKPIADLELPADLTSKLLRLHCHHVGSLIATDVVTFGPPISYEEEILVRHALREKFDLELGIDLYGWIPHDAGENLADRVKKVLGGELPWWMVVSNAHLHRRVEELNLSPKLLSSLKNAGISEIWQLAELTEADVLKLRNFGRGGLNKVMVALAACDLPLNMAHPDVWSFSIDPKYFPKEASRYSMQTLANVEATIQRIQALGDYWWQGVSSRDALHNPQWVGEPNKHLGRKIDTLETSVRLDTVFKYIELQWVWQLAQMTREELLKAKNLGAKSLSEIEEILRGLDLCLNMRDPDVLRQHLLRLSVTPKRYGCKGLRECY